MKKKSIIFGTALTLILAMLSTTVCFMPVSAKNLNLPPGADLISYYTSGHAIIDLPNPLPENYPPTATRMYIGVFHDEIPNAKFECDRLYIQLWAKRTPTSTSLSWNPFAEIVTNSEMADFLRVLWGGTAIAFPSTLYGQPASWSTDNVFLVSDDGLAVERHGNSLQINLAEPQQIKRTGSANTYFTLPALNMELEAFGEATHTESTSYMTGYPGAWGGSYTVEAMGFQATGTLTINDPTWNLNAAPMSGGSITMHGIQTFYPPQ